MKWTLPNILTLLRIVLIPVLVIVFYLPVPWSSLLSAAIFGLAAITDWLDGFLARRLRQQSVFGAFLDPVADKLMVTVVLVLLVEAHHNLLFTIPVAIIIGREIAISALREWMSEVGERATVAVSVIGKIKTTAQMIAILLLLYNTPVGHFPTHEVGVVLLYAAAILTLWSMLIYLRAAWPVMVGNQDGPAGPDA
ncbi:MAG: CDP-diacylglycerol--glycerol-3-phosphate 3-phosphatidyltransferase [Gammaproteobacteria bacterium]|nr:CDP-diacylglycerol--glycerol-3-phosphate 3-phosphatidyltransferase [Gammaproteobacteria bacterium]